MSENFVICNSNLEAFVGEKVEIIFESLECVGVVVETSFERTVIFAFDSLKMFGILGTKINFTSNTFEFALTPTILGRKFDFKGNPIDRLGEVLPLEKSSFEPAKKVKTNSTDKFLISSLLRRGEYSVSKKVDYLQILERINQDNFALVIVGKKDLKRERILQQTDLDNVCITFESNSKSSKLWKQALEMAFIAAKYIALELKFDVLILVDGWEDYILNCKKNEELINQFCKPSIPMKADPEVILKQTFASKDCSSSVSLLGI